MRTVTDIVVISKLFQNTSLRKYGQAVFAICELRRQFTFPAPFFYMIFYAQFIKHIYTLRVISWDHD